MKTIYNNPEVTKRFNYLRCLKDGWFDGKGEALSSNGLFWLEKCFSYYYLEDFPFPYMYPTPEGNVQIECTIGTNHISLEIELATHRGYWHNADFSLADISSATVETKTLNLDQPNGWEWFICKLEQLKNSK